MRVFVSFMVFLLCTGILNAQCSSGYCDVPNCEPNTCSQCPDGQCGDVMAADSVLRVRSEDGQYINYGSGAVVRYDNALVFLTAWHVVSDGPNSVSVSVNGEWKTIAFVYADKDYDFAIYTAPSNVAALPIGFIDEQSGDQVYACGYGKQGRRVCSILRFLRKVRPRNRDQSDFLVFQGGVQSGDSGGPIIDRNGNVVACVWGATAEGSSGESYATRSERVAGAIDEILKQYSYVEGVFVSRCQYVDESGCFNGRCPTPTPMQRSPSQPGIRQPIPDIRVPINPPTLKPLLPPSTASNPVTVNIPQDQSVMANWATNLADKIETNTSRIDGMKSQVDEAIRQGKEISTALTGRVDDLSARANLHEQALNEVPNRISEATVVASEQILKQVPVHAAAAAGQAIIDSKPFIVSVADEVVKSHYVTIIACALAAIMAAFILYHRWFRKMDKADGKEDGYIDKVGLQQRIRALEDAKDGKIDLQYPAGYSPFDRNYGDLVQAAVIATLKAQQEAKV